MQTSLSWYLCLCQEGDFVVKAYVWFLRSVCVRVFVFDMFGAVRLPFEFFPTVLAFESFFCAVHGHVQVEVGLAPECFRAFFAFELVQEMFSLHVSFV